MSARARKLQQEADLIGRFVESYRRRFSTVIDRMNRGVDPAADSASLRLCVEAMDMLLANQQELSRILGELTQSVSTRSAA